jgi:phosphatidylinositol-3-phosphatase
MARPRRLVLAAVLAFAALAASATIAFSRQRRAPLPPIRHVFVIVLENQGFDTTFNAQSRAPYLADTLRKAGAFLRQYYGIGHYSLPNYVAMIAGVAPTPQTQIDCPHFDDFVETGIARDGQPIGDGCVYPSHVTTVVNQLEAKRLTWGGFMEDMGNDPAREAGACGHPAIGTVDSTELATPTDQYATKHNPFVYFHAIIDSASCKRNVVPLTKLDDALGSADRTPNFTFVVPNLCHDGHDRPCTNGEPGGLESANIFLRHWIPRIMSSPAYKTDGLIIVTFDEALSIDARACCDQRSGPNTQMPGVNGPGGGRTGAVLLSRFIKAGTVSNVPYNHYSLLRSIEDVFGLPHLGYASRPRLASFGRDVFTHYSGAR